MIRFSHAICLIAALGAAACTSPDQFGGDDNLVDLNDQAGLTGLEDAADPSSPAYFQQTVGDRVLFLVDQSTLTPDARQTVLAQANWLRANPDYNVVVEGHADEQGTREYNLALGARRASAVQQFLISQGVEAGRVRTLTYGKERPISICSEESCYAQNRRAVTVISAGGLS